MVDLLKPLKYWIGRDSPHEDFKAAVSVGTTPAELQQVTRKRKKILGRVLGYENKSSSAFSRSGTGDFVSPVYDLAEVARAADVEPYVDQSIRKHREQILKEGYEIVGAEDEMVEYIRERLFEIALVTGIPTEAWIREAITNLIKFHNSFLAFRRDDLRSSGSRIRLYGKELKPIAGIFVADPTSMAVKVDKYGTIQRWKQTIGHNVGNSTEKTFPPEDILLVTMDKNTGFTFGTPYILPVLEDIRALRRLEELAVVLASKEVFPVYHYKVGTDQFPAEILEDGKNEVDLAAAQVVGMPMEGNIVTSHRHEITLISRDGSALDIGPFLDYFEARVLAGLRASPIDLGRGGTANRNCYAGDTETLTDSGWKNHWDIDIDRDRIATFNPKSDEIEFHKAKSKSVHPYSGYMYHFKGIASDIMVTPDHDMWVLEDEKWVKKHAEDVVLPATFRISTSPGSGGVPVQDYKFDNLQFSGEQWLQFLAYFIQYGKLAPHRDELKLILRSKNNADEVKSYLADLGLSAGKDYRLYDNDGYTKIAINHAGLVDHIAMHCAAREYPKRIPSYVMHATSDHLETFYETLTGSNTECKTAIYYARTKTLAGQVQEIALRLGKCAKVLQEGTRPRVVISSSATTIVEVDGVEKVMYEGDVYCFTVPNHLFVTRRNGIVAIQGNTADTINKNIQDASKDYQQAFATQVTYGLLFPLLLEGGFNVNHENLVRLAFPPIDREEMRAQQNHGLQMYLANGITCTELRKDFLNKKPMSDEDKKDTTRAADSEAEESLAKVAAAARPAPAGSAKKSTSSASKTASNRGQPRNQHGSKSAKTRHKRDNYRLFIKSQFEITRKHIASLLETDLDELSVEELKVEIKKTLSKFSQVCMASGKAYLNRAIDSGFDTAIDQDGSSEDMDSVGRRARQNFFSNFVSRSFDKCITPYLNQVYAYVTPDIDGNSARYSVYGAISSMHSALARLADQQVETAKRFGFAKAARTLGYIDMCLENTESGGRKTIELNKGPIMYRNLMPNSDDMNSDLILGTKLIQDTEDDSE